MLSRQISNGLVKRRRNELIAVGKVAHKNFSIP